MKGAVPKDAIDAIMWACGIKCFIDNFTVLKRVRYTITIIPAMYCPMIVATAAPAIHQLNTATKKKSNIVFTMAPTKLMAIVTFGLPSALTK